MIEALEDVISRDIPAIMAKIPGLMDRNANVMQKDGMLYDMLYVI